MHKLDHSERGRGHEREREPAPAPEPEPEPEHHTLIARDVKKRDRL